MALLIEAGQMTASDYVPIYPDLPLASEGASTDAIRPEQPRRYWTLIFNHFELNERRANTVRAALDISYKAPPVFTPFP